MVVLRGRAARDVERIEGLVAINLEKSGKRKQPQDPGSNDELRAPGGSSGPPALAR